MEKLTLRKVGERAQVSHATIAYYFKTRQQLVDSALLEISVDFLDVLRQRQLYYGMQDLVELTERFLDGDNPSARFVVQMIDAGQHDVNLRATHDEFVRYGRDRIEKSMRAAMEVGELRSDIDPKVAAALMHTVLIWWQSELAAGAATREVALDVGQMVLRLLEKPAETSASHRNGNGRLAGVSAADARTLVRTALASPVEVINASLLNDPNLSDYARTTLIDTFQKLYELAANVSRGEE